MGTKERKLGEREEEKKEDSARTLLRVREEAAYGIGAGNHALLRGAVNIESIEERLNWQVSASFAANPAVSDTAPGGLHRFWVLLPRAEESLLGLRRRSEDEDPSRN